MCAPVWYYKTGFEVRGEPKDQSWDEINKRWKAALQETFVHDYDLRLDALRELYDFAREDKTGKISKPMYEEIKIRKEVIEEELRRRGRATA
jgi:hypothetical protein